MTFRTRSTILSTLALATALVLAGCGGNDDAQDPATGSAPAATSTTGSAASSPTDGSDATASATPSSDSASPDSTAPDPAASGAQATDEDSAGATDPMGSLPSEEPVPHGSAPAVEPGGQLPAPAPRAHPSQAPGVSAAACDADELSGAVVPQQGAAGSIILSITLTNTGSTPCTLAGYPGVSSADANGAMIGVPAVRGTSTGSAVTLAPGQSATASLRQGRAENYGQVCNAHPTASLVVYPPDSYHSLSLPYQTQACANPKIAQLEIQGFGA